MLAACLCSTCCSKGDDNKRTAAEAAEDAAHSVDHDQGDVGKQIGDRVAIACVRSTPASFFAPPTIIPKHPIAAEDDPDEEEKGDESF